MAPCELRLDRLRLLVSAGTDSARMRDGGCIKEQLCCAARNYRCFWFVGVMPRPDTFSSATEGCVGGGCWQEV